MASAPYGTGERVILETPEGPVDATVSMVVQTTSVDPRRRWRVLCRRPDGSSIAAPFYCGDDGSGPSLRRSSSPARAADFTSAG